MILNKKILPVILKSSPVLSAFCTVIFFYVLSSQYLYETNLFNEIVEAWTVIFSLPVEEYQRNITIINDYILFYSLCVLFIFIFIFRSLFFEWPFIRPKYKEQKTLSLLKRVCFGAGKEASILGLLKTLAQFYFILPIMVLGAGAIFYGGADDNFYHLFETYGLLYYLITSVFISLVFIIWVPFTLWISIILVNEFFIKERFKKG